MALQQTYELPLTPQPIIGHAELELSDGQRTTIHYAQYARTAFQAQVVTFTEATPLLEWCRENSYHDAINGGFFLRSIGQPLGELHVQGQPLPFVPFDSDHGPRRGSIHVDAEGNIQLGPRHVLPETPEGDLLQAGPLLLHDNDVTHRSLRSDPEKFSQTAHQHDADITAERYPRAAIGCNGQYIWTISADGRHPKDAGLYLHELAGFMKSLGVESALNLDGGSSSTHISAGQLLNKPRTDYEESSEGFPIYNAIVFTPRTTPPQPQLVK
ncbi:MAG TPA: phosphodiester glycosidase family protein [Candidatus Saccharimonadales bacterium]